MLEKQMSSDKTAAETDFYDSVSWEQFVVLQTYTDWIIQITYGKVKFVISA